MKHFLCLLIVLLLAACQVQFEETNDTLSTVFSNENTAQKEASYKMEIVIGKLSINTNTTNLMDAICKYNMPKMKPELNVLQEQNRDIVTIGYAESVSLKSIKKATSKWNLRVNPEKSNTFEIEAGMLDLDLDLDQTYVKEVKIEGGTARGEISIGYRDSLQTVLLTTGISRLTIYIPESLPTEVDMIGGITTFDYDELPNFEKKESENEQKRYKNFIGNDPKLKIFAEGGIVRITVKPLASKE